MIEKRYFKSNKQQILECVPNFSEGVNNVTIEELKRVILSVKQVYLLHVDSGKAANRTVISFAGEPDAVCEAAFRVVRRASELIDMRSHQGEHPRFGATDVLPLVPLLNISMMETVELAHKLGKRIGDELGIPGYFYEFAATEEKRRNLASCRAGEYEGLEKKLIDPAWRPDFGPAALTDIAARSGAIALGARNVLLAYNVNLNTKSVQIAQEIAATVREKGRVKRENNRASGAILRDANGNVLYEPGILKAVKGLGWYIEDFGVAQVSYNLTDLSQTSMHQLFETTKEQAEKQGVRVTGSELIGLVPLKDLLDAGRYYLQKKGESMEASDDILLKEAIRSMGLDDVEPFEPRKKIIEYLLEDVGEKKLADYSLRTYIEKTAAHRVIPAGGSALAVGAAIGTSLAQMVANLSARHESLAKYREEFQQVARLAQDVQGEFLYLIDEDSRAVQALLDAFRLPQTDENAKLRRADEIQKSAIYATEVPLQIMYLGLEAMKLFQFTVEKGFRNAIPDATAGALLVRAAVQGSAMNIRVNGRLISDKDRMAEILSEVAMIEKDTLVCEAEILNTMKTRLGVDI